MRVETTPALTFDDVTLEPSYSTITSRFSGEIDTSTNILPFTKLSVPIISANMDTITGCTMAQTMNDLGGLGIIHRYLSVEQHITALSSITGPRIACVGVGDREFSRAQAIVQQVNIDGFLIDIAHAHCKAVWEMITRLKRLQTATYQPLPIIVGNVSTYDGALWLFRLGVQGIKVGQGSGSLCSTRVQTGNGIPQLTAIMEAARARETFLAEPVERRRRPSIIADGGIRQAGDVVKALSTGADAVMIGSLLAGSSESLGILAHDPTDDLCTYRGMASENFKTDVLGHSRGIEGESSMVLRKGSAVTIIDRLMDGLLSGMSYQGARNISELQENAVFRVQTLAGVIEGTPHLLSS